MKKIAFILTLSILVSSCVTGIKGNGKVTKENRNVQNFDHIDVSGSYNVFLKKGDQESVTVEADDNLLEFIEIVVHGNELKIGSKRGFRGYEKLNVYVTFKELKGIDISGACDIKSEGIIKTKFFELELSGASDAILELDCDALEASASGSSDMKLRGKAEVAEFDLSGASDLKASNLKTKRCKIDMSGASDADIYVTKKIVAEASGASGICYHGKPEDVQTNVSGAATIKDCD